MSTRDKKRGCKSMRKRFRSGALTFCSYATLFLLTLFSPSILKSFPLAHGSYTVTSPNGLSSFRSIIVSHSKCAQTLAFFHSSTRETRLMMGKKRNVENLGNKWLRIRILEKHNIPISSVVRFVIKNMKLSHTHTLNYTRMYTTVSRKDTFDLNKIGG